MTDNALEPVDAEVVTETDLEPRPPSLFHTDDPVEVLDKATAVANALKRAVEQQGMIQKVKGKDHAKVEAWQTLGSMLGVTAVCVHTEPTEDRHGKHAYKATVEARYHGTVVGQADALCSTSEGHWKNADDYALLSMAQTRATSKALKGPLGWVMKLAGYESTPAEEMPRDQQPEQRANPVIEPASNQLRSQAFTALTYLMDGDEGLAKKAAGEIREALQVPMPGGTAMALVVTAAELRQSRQQRPEPVPSEEPEGEE